jgi:hypothetical protein
LGNIELTGSVNGQVTTVGSLTGNLIELMLTMLEDGRTFIVIAEFADHRYVQLWVQGDGIVTGEVISNLNIGGAVALSPEDEEELRGIGFSEPQPVTNPNWWYVASDNRTFTRLASMMNLAIYLGLKESSENPVTIRTWEAEIPDRCDREDFRASQRVYVRKFLKEVEEFGK